MILIFALLTDAKLPFVFAALYRMDTHFFLVRNKISIESFLLSPWNYVPFYFLHSAINLYLTFCVQ